MGRKVYLPVAVLLSTIFSAAAQTGEIRGKITEKGSKEGVPFSSVAAMQDGAQIIATVTDIDGNYTLKPLTPGKYDVKASSVGYSASSVTGVIVSVDHTSKADIDLGKGIDIGEVKIYAIPIIDVGSPSVQKTMTYDEIQQAPVRDVNSLASTAAGVFSQDAGGELNIRGTRSEGTAYYVDGIHVRGNIAVASKGAEQITVITGGLPAQYGDATGGVISVTTRGPSKNWTGGIEASSSHFLNEYNNNTLSFALSGPIYTKKDSIGLKTGQPLAGFFLTGDYNYNGDPNPSAVGSYKVKDEILDDIHRRPLIKNPTGSGFYQRTQFLTMDSLDKTKARSNVWSRDYTLNGKLDFNLAKNVTFTLGGTYFRNDFRNPIGIFSLMNYDNNNQVIQNTWRTFGKFTQRFGGTTESAKSASAVKSGFYTLQVDYNQFNQTVQNDQHKDRIWEYAYVGQFTTHQAPYYQTVYDTLLSFDRLYAVYVQPIDTQYSYIPSSLNPNTSAYTTQYYNESGAPGSMNELIAGGGLINGQNTQGINLNTMGLWASPGLIANQYQKTQTNQFSLKASGQVDIGKHTVVLGMEYEQRVDRVYQLAPNSLWDAALALGNFNIRNLDLDHPMFVGGADLPQNLVFLTDETGFTSLVKLDPTKTFMGTILYDTIVNYNYLYVPTKNLGDSQNVKGFYENVRDRLGVPYNQWVDMNHLTPDFYRNSVDLFTMDELRTQGLIGYYGYDKLGNKVSDATDINDYLYKKDETNNFTRYIGPYSPVYVAGYIQDKFQFNDLTFNIGLRIDRFDANQIALKDNYLLYPAYTAGSDAVKSKFPTTAIPAGIGNDYIVYVNDVKSPTKILGYRNNDKWYDTEGNSITDLTTLTAGIGTVQPYLIDGGEKARRKVLDPAAFADYEPQTNFMPRIAFAFPISDDADFKAHYDILTQRPAAANVRFNPGSYFAMADGTANVALANGNLKPERTTDYEIQFEQKLSRSSKFGIHAFYKEMHDMIEIINVTYAYPIDYQTYGNVDFGTVKGLILDYDLRRTGNVRFNASYTLQFANGTGSSPGSNAGVLAQQGQTNLRELIPLTFDQRHTIVASIDYRYESGKDYNGPVWFNKQVFAKAGLNLVFRANSGRPYSRQKNVLPTADFTVNTRSSLDGSINGSRNPWNVRMDLKADKDFTLKMGNKASGESRKPFYMNIYLLIENVMDAQNVLRVYQATGSPSDDGYLSSAVAQNSIRSQVSPQAYRDQYYVSQLTGANIGGSNYSLPRRMRLGLQLNF